MALVADALIGTALAWTGLPGLEPVPWRLMLAMFAYAAFSCRVINDAIKVMLIRRLVPEATSARATLRFEQVACGSVAGWGPRGRC